MAGTLMWIGQNFAQGAGKYVAGVALNELLSVVGFPTAEQRALEEVRRRLDEISGQLRELQAQVDLIKAQLVQIAAALKLTNTYIVQVEVQKAVSAINTLYGTPATEKKGRAGAKSRAKSGGLNLQMLLQKKARGEDTTADVEALAETVLETLPGHVQEITDFTLPGVGTSQGLLGDWVEHLIAKARETGSHDLFASYLSLEGWFLSLFTHQVRGVGLIVAAHCRTIGPPDTAGAVAAKPLCATGRDYLAGYGAQVRQQADRFLACVERLVLHDYQTRAPGNATGSGQIDAARQRVLTRADIVAAGLREAFSFSDTTTLTWEQRVSGCYGRVLCRPSDLRDAPAKEGPPLDPGPNVVSPASRGRRSPDQTGCRSVDWEVSDDAYAHLADCAQTNVTIVRYAWRWARRQVPPKHGVPFKPGFQDGVAGRYYDIATLEPLQNPAASVRAGNGRVFVADFTDVSPLFRAPGFKNATAAHKAWTRRGPEGWDDHTVLLDQSRYAHYTFHELERHPLSLQADTFILGVDHASNRDTTSIRGTKVRVEHRVTYECESPLFKYRGSPARVQLDLGIRSDARLLEGPGDIFMSLLVEAFLKTEQNGQTTEQRIFNSAENGKSLWGRRAGAETDAENITPIGLNLENGQRFRLRYLVTATLSGSSGREWSKGVVRFRLPPSNIHFNLLN